MMSIIRTRPLNYSSEAFQRVILYKGRAGSFSGGSVAPLALGCGAGAPVPLSRLVPLLCVPQSWCHGNA